MHSLIRRLGCVTEREATRRDKDSDVSRKTAATPRGSGDPCDYGDIGKAPIVADTQSLASKENYVWSPFYRLPAELHLMIADYLSPTTIITVRLTSRRLYDALPNPTHIPPAEQVRFKDAKKLDNFAWNCRRERHFGIEKLKKLSCSVCKVLHPKRQFRPKMLQELPERRICLGAEGVVWLCKHSWITMDELTALKGRRLNISERELSDFRLCTHEGHGRSPLDRALCAPIVKSVTRKETGGHMSLAIERFWIVLRLVGDEKVTPAVLEKSLKSLRDTLCPHITTNDVRKILPPPSSDSRYPFHQPHTGRTLEHTWSTWNTPIKMCRDADCDTIWNMHRRHRAFAGKPDEIVLQVVRLVHPGLEEEIDAMNASWNAQIGPPPKKGTKNCCSQGERFFACCDEVAGNIMRGRCI